MTAIMDNVKEIGLEFFGEGGEVLIRGDRAIIIDAYNEKTVVQLDSIDWLEKPNNCNRVTYLAYLASENLLEKGEN